MTFTAVGISEGADRRVVIVLHENVYTTIELNEDAARKLADDILRNANHLWPIKQEDK